VVLIQRPRGLKLRTMRSQASHPNHEANTKLMVYMLKTLHNILFMVFFSFSSLPVNPLTHSNTSYLLLPSWASFVVGPWTAPPPLTTTGSAHFVNFTRRGTGFQASYISLCTSSSWVLIGSFTLQFLFVLLVSPPVISPSCFCCTSVRCLISVIPFTGISIYHLPSHGVSFVVSMFSVTISSFITV